MKKATIYDVAREAGVSLATVSRVINGSSVVREKTKEKVMKVIDELNFKPNQIARGLATNKTTTIAIIFPQSLFAHVKDMIGGIGDAGRTLDYNITIYTTDDIGNGPMDDVMEKVIRTDKHSFKPQKEEVDLTLLIESVIEELQQKAAYKNISLLFEYIPQNESYIIQGDTMLLMRMIYNLIENAINYGINGGCVWVNLIKNQENTDIIIKDNGIGIEKEHLDKIWNRFYRVDKSRSTGEGFGLGLSMVRFIVDIHGGSIAIKSKPGYGTTFTVSL